MAWKSLGSVLRIQEVTTSANVGPYPKPFGAPEFTGMNREGKPLPYSPVVVPATEYKPPTTEIGSSASPSIQRVKGLLWR